jgi:hypothetical protein
MAYNCHFDHMVVNTPDTLITPSCITAKALFQHLAPTHWEMLCWPQTWHPGHLMTHHDGKISTFVCILHQTK